MTGKANVLAPLPRDAYARLAPLTRGMEHHLALVAILAGTSPGSVHVDDPGRPTAALVAFKRRFHLIGDPACEAFVAGARARFADVIYPRGLAEGAWGMFVLYYPPGWEGAAVEILRGRHPIADRYRYLALGEPPPHRDAPADLDVRDVDAALLEEAALGNLEALREEMTSERESVDAFLASSFGVCLVRRGEIVGFCLSEYNTADRCEVGIWTAAPHRRRGYATLAGTALAERAFSRGVRGIGWHCWAGNAASFATARRIGFLPEREYGVHFAYYHAATNDAVHANVRLRAGDYAGALEWFERAARTGQAPAWAHFVAAGAHARLGEEEAALAALREAVDRGFRDAEAIRSSEHLRGLRGSPGWRAIVEGL